jgi:hypothetical protein
MPTELLPPLPAAAAAAAAAVPWVSVLDLEPLRGQVLRGSEALPGRRPGADSQALCWCHQRHVWQRTLSALGATMGPTESPTVGGQRPKPRWQCNACSGADSQTLCWRCQRHVWQRNLSSVGD